MNTHDLYGRSPIRENRRHTHHAHGINLQAAAGMHSKRNVVVSKCIMISKESKILFQSLNTSISNGDGCTEHSCQLPFDECYSYFH